MTSVRSVTTIAPVNIAAIKYWGKRNENLILPLNDSLSVTLSTDYMSAKTSVAISPHFKEDKIWLNGKEESIENIRIQNCLRNIRNMAKKEMSDDEYNWKVHICSVNNFPTAAGLASSSAGYACLVFALAQIYNVKGNLSSIARQGSGSACRSMFGGFVQWQAGTKPDGSDSIAVQLAPETHWPELKILILVVNDQQKKTSSSIGMQRTAETSQLLQYRIQKCVPENMQKIIQAIKNKNFNTFAEITMRDSNQFHAVCMDTFPPITYLNNTSHSIISFVHQYNDAAKCYKVCYTYDAGPNACLFVLEKDMPRLLATIVQTFFRGNVTNDIIKGIPVDFNNEGNNIPKIVMPLEDNLLKYIIVTKIGTGPTVVPNTESLLSCDDGLPKN